MTQKRTPDSGLLGEEFHAGAQALDAISVQKAIAAMVMAADRGDWVQCRSFFTEHVTIDHDGQEPGGKVSADDVIAGWATLFAHFTFSQHVVTNHVIDLHGSEAECSSYVFVTHAIASKSSTRTHTEQGRYRHKLQRQDGNWLISSVTYHKLHEEGDAGLLPD